MTTDEKLAVLAKAIKELAEKAAHTWDYGGESMVGEGVVLVLERDLDAIIAEAEAGS